MPQLETERLSIRNWEKDDVDHLIRLRTNPEVMRHFPGTDSADEIRQMFPEILKRHQQNGYGFCPVFEKLTGNFIGFCGIQPVRFETGFTPATEIGWSLLPQFWGKGYATEAAKAWLEYGFGEVGLDRIVAFAVKGNEKSHSVMNRLGMTRSKSEDFDHPNVPPDYPHLVRHLVWFKERRK